ncbi:PREDICTED: frizzled-2-like [Branchiostoma belcheri]|uniref:Frizzled-2-like n=1 Tax=Branchiostoma belcheri TaxID=7741 RepID=A0A6P5A5W9_BRABE|nr:PREDICTED: frizzled-2-like [Branchiostoma belcheri]
MYNMTALPNILGHTKQDEASLEVHQYYPLVKMGCSDVLDQFLCFVYAPPCTVLDSAIPPCRSLCESARGSCEGLMMKFGFAWPDNLDCSKFPEDHNLCLGTPVGKPANTKAPPVPGYQGRVGDCSGNEIWPLYGKGIQLEECARRCTDEADCVAFMYSEGNCHPKFQTYS